MIIISLEVSALPKEKIKKAENGKLYINLILSERKEKDNYGNTHYLAVSKTKEEREAKVDTIYCGSGKRYEEKPVAVTPEMIDELPAIDDTSNILPF